MIEKSRAEGWARALSAARTSGPSSGQAVPPQANDLLQTASGVAILEKLAICFHDRDAARFILTHHEPLLYFVFAGTNGSYLLYLARKMGVLVPDFDALIAALDKKIAKLSEGA